MQEKTYQPLLDDCIYFGGANDVSAMVEQDGIEVIVDLRTVLQELYPQA